MLNGSGIERARQLREALAETAGESHIPPTSLERFGHFFGHTVTILEKSFGRGEILGSDRVEEARTEFLSGIALINFTPDDLAKVQPIVDLAQKAWTPELIEQLVAANNIAFPRFSLADRRKIRDEEMGVSYRTRGV